MHQHPSRRPRIISPEQGEPVRFTRRGKPVAVLVSAAEYQQLHAGQERRDFWDLITEMRAAPSFAPVDWPLEEVNAWRDRRPARDFAWPE
jgi:antitoxin (DNA-binding transcriptional repressor) of toxin-antitoxin stability system